MSYKQTNYWIVDKMVEGEDDDTRIREAALWIKKGELIAFPTETVYGLGANALDEQAVRKIFTAKGRPSDNPLIVHIADQNQLNELVIEVPHVAKTLMESFWPGPLTIIFKKKEAVAASVTAGLDTVAVRMPDHPIARELLRVAAVPVAAPSANLSGKPSPTSAAHVHHDLNGRIAGIIDGGQTGIGVESTVIDCTKSIPVLCRHGGVSIEDIKKVVGKVDIHPSVHSTSLTPVSPGMKYTHYAPNGMLYLVRHQDKMNELIAGSKADGKRVGVLITEENENHYEADVTVICGRRDDLSSVANALYDSLRLFDSEGAEVIYAETFPIEGLGAAIMDRLEKAACGRSVIE